MKFNKIDCGLHQIAERLKGMEKSAAKYATSLIDYYSIDGEINMLLVGARPYKGTTSLLAAHPT